LQKKLAWHRIGIAPREILKWDQTEKSKGAFNCWSREYTVKKTASGT